MQCPETSSLFVCVYAEHVSVLLTTMVAATLHKGSGIITAQQPSFQTLQNHLSILCSYSVLAFRGGNGVGVPLAIRFPNFL